MKDKNYEAVLKEVCDLGTQAEKAMKRTGVLDTKKTLSTDHLCHITREVIQYADLLKVFTNVYVRSANRVEIWGELECFSDDVDGWVETVSHDKRYYDKRIKHDGVDVLISLYESLPQRKEYEEHE